MTIGDVVRFNAGGPPMNVTAISPDGLMVTVLWVVSGDASYSTAMVPAVCLKTATGV
jgi:uncharacterized protein YodC (DUF2158 family)